MASIISVYELSLSFHLKYTLDRVILHSSGLLLIISISCLEKFKKDYWLDLKINDIPQTALSAVDSLKDLKNCKYLTVHANGGLEMLKAIKKRSNKINKNLKILGVTILTSLNDNSLKKIGYNKKVKQLALKQASLIKEAGCDGVVCSAHEAKIIKKKYKSWKS